ncbi:MAG TPA: hypothetical protein VF657_13315 [Actinoplanes sp.]
MEGTPSRPPRRYDSRPGRTTVVTATLDELRGPVGGTVELPNSLLWLPDRAVDLDDTWTRGWVYALVLREARRRDDLRKWINGEVLAELWPALNLPRGVRTAWEDRHPVLRRHPAPA